MQYLAEFAISFGLPGLQHNQNRALQPEPVACCMMYRWYTAGARLVACLGLLGWPTNQQLVPLQYIKYKQFTAGVQRGLPLGVCYILPRDRSAAEVVHTI